MNDEEARASVDALIEDLRYLMGIRPHTEWPGMADAAIEHHHPRISDHLLSWQYRRLQRAAHLVLEGLSTSNAEQIRAGIIDIRTIENLEHSPTPVMPKPPVREQAPPMPDEPAGRPTLEVDLDLTIEGESPIVKPR